MRKKESSKEIRQKREARVQSYDTSQRFKAGACKNCGGLKHNAKNCLDKPYAIGAKYKELIYPDEQETVKKKENVGQWERRFVPISRNENGLKISADYVDKSLKTVFINARDRQDIPHYLKA
ncbi:predicted protein [Arabidopsis lyrata subsp. lyrata]|uniref:Predicted protein n=1 Tax=Arabidopsis lyrata subsp. lyrata TaxID=81972 RepID=D7L449_ARALL|nr:predicted protein [Arabidopsis lyrata subsp. lyrata]